MEDTTRYAFVKPAAWQHIDLVDATFSLQDLVSLKSLVAFDTETTGLWAPSNRLVEIAGVKFRPGFGVLETFSELIDPERPIPPEVVPVHGITDEMVAGAGVARDVLHRFLDFCGPETVLVAHNAPFDISFLWFELTRAGMEQPANPILDTCALSRGHLPGMSSYSLLSLCRQFDIAGSQAHRALGDSELVAALFERLVSILTEDDHLDKSAPIGQAYRLSKWNTDMSVPAGFEELQEAVERESEVSIQYRNQSGEASGRIILPLLLFKQSNEHYLNAFCRRAGAERTFRLDRIIKYEIVVSSDG